LWLGAVLPAERWREQCVLQLNILITYTHTHIPYTWSAPRPAFCCRNVSNTCRFATRNCLLLLPLLPPPPPPPPPPLLLLLLLLLWPVALTRRLLVIVWERLLLNKQALQSRAHLRTRRLRWAVGSWQRWTTDARGRRRRLASARFVWRRRLALSAWRRWMVLHGLGAQNIFFAMSFSH
jgi:hypothetical protein